MSFMKSIFFFITALVIATNIHAATNKPTINKNIISKNYKRIKDKKISTDKIQSIQKTNIPLHTSDNLKETIKNQINNLELSDNNNEIIDNAEEIDKINEIKKIWEESKPIVSDEDIVIQHEQPNLFIPEEHLTLPENMETIHIEKNHNEKKTENKNSPVKMNVQLRHPLIDKSKKANKDKPNISTVKKAIPIVNVPTMPTIVKPVLTRRQVLEQEIGRERAALNSAKLQLNSAQKTGNLKQINKLNNLIKDRQLNIQSIQKEMMR